MQSGVQSASKRILPLLIIGAIAFVFVLQFGPASQGWQGHAQEGKTDGQAAAVVNGKEITSREFNLAYSQRLEQFRRSGYSIDDQQARALGVPRSILNQMVDLELLAQAAERRGVVASDEELATQIHKIPVFQKDGQFDFEQYQDSVRQYFHQSVTEFEADLRRQLNAQKMSEMVRGAAAISDDELKAKYLREGNKAQATVVKFSPTAFASQVKAPTDAEVSAWAKAHGKEISDYYAANAFLYKQPEEVHARHILVKIDRNATPEQKNVAKQKAEELRKQVTKGGKDFAEVAKASSEDVGSKSSGGDLGFNRRENWVPEFANAAFALKAGEVSPVVESPFGFHVIKVEERKAATEKSVSDVTPEIAKVLLTQEKAKALAQAEADKALAAMKSGKKLADLFPAAKAPEKGAPPADDANKPHAIQTGAFVSNGDAIPLVGASAALAQAIFSAEGPKALDQVYPLSDGSLAVAEVTDRDRPSDEKFAQQKEKLRDEALRAKQYELERSFVDALRKTAQNDKKLQINEQLVGAEAPALGG